MARDSDSYIFRKGVTPNTLSVISSKNRIFAYNATGQNVQIGVVATFDPSEARTIEPVRGIGFGDQIAELVPSVTDPLTISVTRTALYLSNIFQVFGYKAGIDGIARSLKHHRWPFDVRQEVVFSGIAAENTDGSVSQNVDTVTVDARDEKGIYNQYAIITYYEACWISDYSVSYASDAALVQETVTINASDVLAGPGLYPYTQAEVEPYSVLDTGEARSSRYQIPSF